MGKDINFINKKTVDGFLIEIGSNPSSATGNRLMANIFEITYATSINSSLLSNGYGGDGNNLMSSVNREDFESASAVAKIASDNTVAAMKADQDKYGELIPDTEKIKRADIKDINQVGDRVFVTINLVPEAYDNPSNRNILSVIPL